jgi:hypothetical protein
MWVHRSPTTSYEPGLARALWSLELGDTVKIGRKLKPGEVEIVWQSGSAVG